MAMATEEPEQRWWHPLLGEWEQNPDLQELTVRMFEVEQEHIANEASVPTEAQCSGFDAEHYCEDDMTVVSLVLCEPQMRLLIDAYAHVLQHECDEAHEVLMEWIEWLVDVFGHVMFGE